MRTPDQAPDAAPSATSPATPTPPGAGASPGASQLEAWVAQEEEMRRRISTGRGPGLATPAELAGRSGLDLLQAMLRGEVPSAPVGRTLDFLLLEVEPGRALFQGQPGADHLNPLGTVHGGWASTLLDSALGCAVHTLVPAGRAYTTADLGVKFVRALSPKVLRVRAEGKVVHAGRQMATAEARLFGPDGTLYATGTTTCLLFDVPGR